MAIIFQIVLWGCIITLAYLAINFLSLHTFSPVITSISNSIKTPPQGFPNPLILGIFSSILATIAVLITREMFYYIRDRLPAGALFRNIARVSDPCLIFTLRMKDTTQSGNFITPIPNFSAIHDQRYVNFNDIAYPLLRYRKWFMLVLHIHTPLLPNSKILQGWLHGWKTPPAV